MGWRTTKFCLIGCAVVCLAHAGTNGTPLERFQRLQEAVRQGNFESARNQLNAAIKEFPTDPGLYNLLGIVEAQQGNHSAAEANFKKALVYAPESTSVLLNLGGYIWTMHRRTLKAPRRRR